ncbi:LOW QUALITY PROTEIN: armadillo repeat-containing protein 7 [Musca autumnalis]|uniref:LOW QUALITY PROTEIN: armadillo repeat-containing protein 7 n=1 Tax=Musca autumnalis TaxID=221902 RepID=UPI003CF2E326
MFSSHKKLKRKTPSPGINREEFIEHLVEEYYTTTNVEAQEQVTANLANFAYDPINWEYLKKKEAVKVFIELLESNNDTLKLHGIAGLCNIILDREISSFLGQPNNFKSIKQLFINTQNIEILLNCCTLIYQLLGSQQVEKKDILSGDTIKRIQQINSQFKSNKRLSNISGLLLSDFCRRYEFIESQQQSKWFLNRCLSTKPSRELRLVKTFSQQDLDNFSQLTGDYNPLHSSSIPPENRMVHGAFLNAVIAGLIGTHYPAGTIVLEQNFKFPKACRINVECQFLIQMQNERKISTVTYECKQGDNIVFEGLAKLLISNKN